MKNEERQEKAKANASFSELFKASYSKITLIKKKLSKLDSHFFHLLLHIHCSKSARVIGKKYKKRLLNVRIMILY